MSIRSVNQFSIRFSDIRGALILPALSLAYAPVSFFLKAIVPFFRHHPGFSYRINFPVLIIDVIILLFALLLIYQFCNRKSIFPSLYIFYILLLTTIWFVGDALIDTPEDPPFIAMLFHIAVIIPVVVFSKRIRSAFNEAPDKNDEIDNILIKVRPFLDRFYAFLLRTRKVLFLWLILFLITVLFVNCTLRSLMNEGDLRHILDYL
jgi:hypothetical protein